MFYDAPPAPAPVVIFEDLAGKRDEFPRRRCAPEVGCTSAISVLRLELNYRGSSRLDSDQPQYRGRGR